MLNNSQNKKTQKSSVQSELNKKTSQRISEIKSLVYWITSKNIRLRKKIMLSKANFNKYFWTTSIDEEINQSQIWKILERVAIEYFIKHARCSLSEYTQEWLWIDFILKYLDLKIWVDFSLNAQLENNKINKLLKTAKKIDEDHEIWTKIQSKRPDLCASMILKLPPYLLANIINWFTKWRENNYQHHWSKYTENYSEIDEYLISIIKIINNLVNENIVRDNLIDTTFEYEWFIGKTYYDIDKEIYHISIFNNLWYKTLNFSIILTKKYFQKVSPWVKFTRIYDSIWNKVKDYYRFRDEHREESKTTNNSWSSNWMFVDFDFDVDPENTIPQNILNKIK